MGNLRQITRGPGDADYMFNYKNVVDPSQDVDVNQASLKARKMPEPMAQSPTLEADVRVYPIPVKSGESLFVEGSFGENTSIRLISQTGQTVRTWENFSSHEIKLEGISPGVYFLKLRDGVKTLQRRLIIL